MLIYLSIITLITQIAFHIITQNTLQWMLCFQWIHLLYQSIHKQQETNKNERSNSIHNGFKLYSVYLYGKYIKNEKGCFKIRNHF